MSQFVFYVIGQTDRCAGIDLVVDASYSINTETFSKIAGPPCLLGFQQAKDFLFTPGNCQGEKVNILGSYNPLYPALKSFA